MSILTRYLLVALLISVSQCETLDKSESINTEDNIWANDKLEIVHIVPRDTRKYPTCAPKKELQPGKESEGTNNQSNIDLDGNSCGQISVFMCLEQSLRWWKGECVDKTEIPKVIQTESSFPIPVPESVREVYDLIVIMWTYPPPGNPIYWALFMVASFIGVLSGVITLFLLLLYVCCFSWLPIEDTYEKEQEQYWSNRKSLYLTLGQSRKYPFNTVLINCAGGKRRLILVPGRSGLSHVDTFYKQEELDGQFNNRVATVKEDLEKPSTSRQSREQLTETLETDNLNQSNESGASNESHSVTNLSEDIPMPLALEELDNDHVSAAEKLQDKIHSENEIVELLDGIRLDEFSQ